MRSHRFPGGTTRQRLYRGTGFVEHVGTGPVKWWGWGREETRELERTTRPVDAESSQGTAWSWYGLKGELDPEGIMISGKLMDGRL